MVVWSVEPKLLNGKPVGTEYLVTIDIEGSRLLKLCSYIQSKAAYDKLLNSYCHDITESNYNGKGFYVYTTYDTEQGTVGTYEPVVSTIGRVVGWCEVKPCTCY